MSNNNQSSQEPEAISQELTSLLDDIIDYCLEELVYNGDFPVMLATCNKKGERDLLSLNGDEIEDCLIEAKRMLASEKNIGERKITQYAIAYNGAIEDIPGSGYQPAIIVEYGEAGLSSGYSLFMFYENEGDVKHFNYTDPAAAGETELYINNL
ncbi:MAG: hypothetical protein IKE43_07160 [Coriobacteriales bacterium]|nr:hypothetical protein [Coriobacteriales bacterium]